MPRTDYASVRKKRIDDLTAQHAALQAQSHLHDPYMVCWCERAKELRALLHLDYLAKCSPRRKR